MEASVTSKFSLSLSNVSGKTGCIDGALYRRIEGCCRGHQGPVRRHFTAAHRFMLCALYRPELSVYKAVRGAKGAVFIPWIIIALVSCTKLGTYRRHKLFSRTCRLLG